MTSTLMRSNEIGGVACEKTWWRKLPFVPFIGGCRVYVLSPDHLFGKVSEGHSLASGQENKVKGKAELKVERDKA